MMNTKQSLAVVGKVLALTLVLLVVQAIGSSFLPSFVVHSGLSFFTVLRIQLKRMPLV